MAGISIKNYIENQTNKNTLGKNPWTLDFMKPFKEKSLLSINENNELIRKTLNAIISTFSKMGGITEWAELPGMLLTGLSTHDKNSVINVLETNAVIIEEASEKLLNNNMDFLSDLTLKVRRLIRDIINSEYDHGILFIDAVLNLLYNLIRKCAKRANNIIKDNYPDLYTHICNLFDKYQNCLEGNILEKVGRIWLKLIKQNAELLINQFEYFFDLFLYYLKKEKYEINLCSCEFFLYIFTNLDFYNVYIINNPNTEHQQKLLQIFQIKFPDFISMLAQIISLRRGISTPLNELDEEQLLQIDEKLIHTPRACAFKLLEYFSQQFPEQVFGSLQQKIESGINSEDPIEKEQALFLLSSIGKTCSSFFQHSLISVFNFLVKILPSNSEEKIVKLQTVFAIISMHSSIILNASQNQEICQIFENYLSNVQGYLKSNDEKFQLMGCTMLNSILSEINAEGWINETNLKLWFTGSYLNYFLEELNACIYNYTAIQCRLKLLQIIEFILNNFTDDYIVLLSTTENNINIPPCQFFPIVVRRLQEITFSIQDSDPAYISVLEIVPSIIQSVGSIYAYYKRIPTIPNNDGLSNPDSVSSLFPVYLQHMFKNCKFLLEQNLNVYTSDKLDWANDVYAGALISILNVIIKTKNLMNLPNIFSDSEINDPTLLDIIDIYAKNYRSLIHKYAIFIGEIAKIKNLEVLNSNMSDVVSFLIECLSNIVDNQEDTMDSDVGCIINTVIFSLGNIVLNYADHMVIQTSCEYILSITLQFFTNQVSVYVIKSILYTYGKIAIHFPELVNSTFHNYLDKYLIKLSEVNLKESDDKFLSLKGIFNAIQVNKISAFEFFIFLSETLLNYENLPNFFKHQYQQLFQFYSQNIPKKFKVFSDSIEDSLKVGIEQKLLS